MEIPLVESWGLFLLLVSHWVAFARLCLGHLGAGLGLGAGSDLPESLWGPKMMQFLGAAVIAHLLLSRDEDGEGRMFSSTASFQQHLFFTREEEKEGEHTGV